jgi:hypothetical protein
MPFSAIKQDVPSILRVLPLLPVADPPAWAGLLREDRGEGARVRHGCPPALTGTSGFRTPYILGPYRPGFLYWGAPPRLSAGTGWPTLG